MNPFRFLLMAALLLGACAAPNVGKPVAYTTVPGKVTVTEYDGANRVIGSYFVEATSLRRNLAAGTLTGPGIPHPLKNYSVDR